MYTKKINLEKEYVLTVEEFLQAVEHNTLIDYDGYGYPVKNGYADKNCTIIPSEFDKIPLDATHIVWFGA